MEVEKIVTFIVVIGVVLGSFLGLYLICRNFLRALTNRGVAEHLGRKTRQAVDNAATKCGRLAGTLDQAAGAIERSFKAGRDSAKK